MADVPTFTEWLRQQMRLHDLRSICRVADAIHADSRSVTKWVMGDDAPGPVERRALAKLFGTPEFVVNGLPLRAEQTYEPSWSTSGARQQRSWGAAR